MLLSVLSVLIGAILVPDEYLWLYSTHIPILCLYLIRRHRFFTLFFVLLSFFSVCLQEFSLDASSVPKVGQSATFCPSQKILYVDQLAEQSTASRSSRVALTLEASNDVRRYYKNIAIEPAVFDEKDTHTQCVSGEIAKLSFPEKYGDWRAQGLYVERQAARVYFKSADKLGMADVSRKSFRQVMSDRLDGLFGGFNSWRFSKALFLGSNAAWSERDTWYVRVLGLAHLFVVSGLHTGFVFGFGCLLSRACWRLLPKSVVLSGVINCWRLDAILVIPMLFCYAYLTQWGAPVVRAGIMLSVYLLAKAATIRFSPYNVVGFALWLILLIEPRSVFQPGLWLSFSLVCLLIGFSRCRLKWSRLIMMQLMLSTASAILILGWQSDISILSIFVNILMIPFAAFIWFPVGIMACLLGLLFGSTYLYGLLDSALNVVLSILEYVAFQMPLISFATFASSVPKYLLLVLLFFWVWQSPLKRGWCCLLFIWVVLLLPESDVIEKPFLQIRHIGNELVAGRDGELLLSDRWHNSVSAQLVERFLRPKKDKEAAGKRMPIILLPNIDGESVSAEALLKNKVDWVLLKAPPAAPLKSRLSAMQINWITIPANQALEFWRSRHQIIVRHLGCSFAIFLFKSDTCRHVETLEFMLN